jgi:polyisoprenyl-teichoic acid--peptidoglycan teichoic acid transferase
VARWALYASVGILALLLLAAVGLVVLYKTPFRAALGWPYPLTERTNVLIMGLDRTVSDQNPNIVLPISRTDTLIAASFDPAARRVYLISVPRDTRASIPGHGTTKINAAHAWGGAPLTTRTVQNFLGVPFPYYIEIQQRGFVHLIDAVGGVNVHIDNDLDYDDNWDGLHIHLKKGHRRLGGQSAIEFARFRHDALGDIGRIARQQQVMNALLDELRQPRAVLHMGRILRVFREDIKTNLTERQLITLGLFGAQLPSGGLIREALPGRFGKEDWLPDQARDRELVARAFYGVDAGVLTHTSVEVIADAASRDAAGDLQARLGALGIPVLRIRTASVPGPTTVVVHRGDPRVAGIVAALAGGGSVADDGSRAGGADLTVRLANVDTGGPATPLRP